MDLVLHGGAREVEGTWRWVSVAWGEGKGWKGDRPCAPAREDSGVLFALSMAGEEGTGV